LIFIQRKGSQLNRQVRKRQNPLPLKRLSRSAGQDRFHKPFFEALGWEITIADEKIDEIVYGLYGVTEEEKGIIEG
jgi:hypothetical protein